MLNTEQSQTVWGLFVIILTKNSERKEYNNKEMQIENQSKNQSRQREGRESNKYTWQKAPYLVALSFSSFFSLSMFISTKGCVGCTEPIKRNIFSVKFDHFANSVWLLLGWWRFVISFSCWHFALIGSDWIELKYICFRIFFFGNYRCTQDTGEKKVKSLNDTLAVGDCRCCFL